MAKTDFSKTVFILRFDEKGYPFVETDTLEHRVEMSAEETTSPRGVMSKLFTDGKQLKYWMPNGHARIVDEYETEEEASQEWLERTYQYDYIDHPDFQDDYESMEECISWAAENMEIDKEVVKSIMHHHDIYREGESRRRAKRLMADFYKAKENANGQITKALKFAASNARAKGYMWGCYDRWSGNRELCIENYYTPEFCAELNAMQKAEDHRRHMNYLRKNLLYAVATWNADPYCVENKEQVEEILAEVEASGEQLVTDPEERKIALAQLDLPADSQRKVVRAGRCLFSEPTYDEVINRIKKQL